jgi:hypothetical protein
MTLESLRVLVNATDLWKREAVFPYGF